jgi:hypothetical protein
MAEGLYKIIPLAKEVARGAKNGRQQSLTILVLANIPTIV